MPTDGPEDDETDETDGAKMRFGRDADGELVVYGLPATEPEPEPEQDAVILHFPPRQRGTPNE